MGGKYDLSILEEAYDFPESMYEADMQKKHTVKSGCKIMVSRRYELVSMILGVCFFL